MTEKKPITAWTVVRVAPGLRDDGVKIGPFFKEEEADEWIDENHKKVFLKEVEFGLHKNGWQLYAVVCRLCAVGKLRIGAVTCWCG